LSRNKEKRNEGGMGILGMRSLYFIGVIKKRKNTIEEIEKKKKSSPPKR